VRLWGALASLSIRMCGLGPPALIGGGFREAGDATACCTVHLHTKTYLWKA